MTRRAKLIAKVLTQSWRSAPPAFEVTDEEFAVVTPLLLRTGAAALAWNRVRRSGPREFPLTTELKEAYQMNSLMAAVRERDLAYILNAFAQAEIEPILVKGWSIARLYGDDGLRP